MAARSVQPGCKRRNMHTRSNHQGICSHCGACWQMPAFEVVLEDEGAPIARSLLPYALRTGFDTAEVRQPGDPVADIFTLVSDLHEAGGHIAVACHGTITRFTLSLPSSRGGSPAAHTADE